MKEKLRQHSPMTEISHQPVELIERIRKANTSLSERGRRVAKLVLARPGDVAMLSAARIAEQLGVSKSTVVRFASSVGYDGYPELRRALQDSLRRQLDPAERLDAFTDRRVHESAIARSFQTDMKDLAATERQLDVAGLNRVVDLIARARETYILGLRSSFSLAFTFHHHLGRMLRGVRLVDPGRGDAIDQLAQLDEQDVLIGIGFPRYTRLTIELMSLAASRDIRVVAITDSPVSPLAEHATITLTASCSAEPFANSNVGALALINAIVSQAAVSSRERSLRALKRLEGLLHDARLCSPTANAAARKKGLAGEQDRCTIKEETIEVSDAEILHASAGDLRCCAFCRNRPGKRRLAGAPGHLRGT